MIPKKKLRQQRNLRQVFEHCGSIWLPCHVSLSLSLGAHNRRVCGSAPCSRFDPNYLESPTTLHGNIAYPPYVGTNTFPPQTAILSFLKKSKNFGIFVVINLERRTQGIRRLKPVQPCHCSAARLGRLVF